MPPEEVMPNKYYQPGQNRAPSVQALFQKISGRYDLINDLQSFGMHRVWKRKLIALAEVKPGLTALDLCCGTGDVSFALARAGASVTGVDFTRGMLDVAERRSEKLPLQDRPSFRQADALQLPFANETFDRVIISYGLRNLRDEPAGIAEMRRVLRPGGKLLILDFGKPENALLQKFYFLYLKKVVPLLGRFLCGDADTHSYIYESLMRYQAQKGVQKEMEKQNLQETRIVNLWGGIMSINMGIKTA